MMYDPYSNHPPRLVHRNAGGYRPPTSPADAWKRAFNTELRPPNHRTHNPKTGSHNCNPRIDATDHSPQERILRPIQYARHFDKVENEPPITNNRIVHRRVYNDGKHMTEEPMMRHASNERRHEIRTTRATPTCEIGKNGYRMPKQSPTANYSDLEDLKKLKAETRELQKQLDKVRKQHKIMDTKPMRPVPKIDKLSNESIKVNKTDDDEIRAKPEQTKHPTEPWLEAMNELFSGVGSIVLAVCKAVNITGKTALSACSGLSTGSDQEGTKVVDIPKGNPNYIQSTRMPSSYQDTSQKVYEERYKMNDAKRIITERGQNHGERRHRPIGYHQNHVNDTMTDRNLRFNDEYSMGIVTRNDWSANSEVDSVSSSGISYDSDESESICLQESMKHSDAGSLFDDRGERERYYRELIVPRDGRYYNNMHDTLYKENEEYWKKWSTRAYEDQPPFYDDKGNHHTNRTVDRSQINFRIDLGDLDNGAMLLPKMAEYPELQPSYKSRNGPELPSIYSRAPGLKNASTANTVGSPEFPRTSATCYPQMGATGDREIPVTQGNTDERTMKNGDSIQKIVEGSPMTKADKTTAPRISKHKPLETIESKEELHISESASEESADNSLDAEADEDGNDSDEDTAYAAVKQEVSTAPEKRMPLATHKSKPKVFSKLWRPKKKETQTNASAASY